MIEKLSRNIVLEIRKNYIHPKISYQLMYYGVSLFINSFVIILISYAMSILIGKEHECRIFLTHFIIIRSISGGYHFNSLGKCIIISSIIVTLVLLFPSTPYLALLFMNTFACITFIKIAPVNFEQNTIVNNKFYIYFKILSACIVGYNFFVMSDLITLSYFIQAVSIIQWKKVNR